MINNYYMLRIVLILSSFKGAQMHRHTIDTSAITHRDPKTKSPFDSKNNEINWKQGIIAEILLNCSYLIYNKINLNS